MKVTAKITTIARTPATEKTLATENYESKCEEKAERGKKKK
jgi:hypothetical protein